MKRRTKLAIAALTVLAILFYGVWEAASPPEDDETTPWPT